MRVSTEIVSFMGRSHGTWQRSSTIQFGICFNDHILYQNWQAGTTLGYKSDDLALWSHLWNLLWSPIAFFIGLSKHSL